MTDTDLINIVRIAFAHLDDAALTKLASAMILVRRCQGGERIIVGWVDSVMSGIEAELCGAGTGKYDDKLDKLRHVYGVLCQLCGRNQRKSNEEEER